MKISTYAVAFLLLTLGACKDAGKSGGSISGQLTHADKITVYFQKVTDKGEETLDSAKTDANGKFTLKNLANGTDYYLFRTNQANAVFLLLSGNEQVEITGDAQSLDASYTVKGSEGSEQIRFLRGFDRQLVDSLNRVYENARNAMPDKTDSIGAILQQTYASGMEEFARNFIRLHPNSLVSLTATKYINQQKDLDLLVSLDAALSKTYPGNKYAEDFHSIIVDLMKLPPGSQAPEISLKSPEGKMISLSSFRGKVVLIDFWASWCAPCRAEMPKVVDLYRRLKGKNFEILGVSLDTDPDSWKEAMKKDGITWPQVSELKRWDSETVKAYNVDAIPFTVIVDTEGKIVAKGLHGKELEEKILETLAKHS